MCTQASNYQDYLSQDLLKIQRIYFEQAALEFERGREIFERHPEAEKIEIASHWNQPGLYGNEGSAHHWVQIKRGVIVIGVKKSLACRRNTRSSDWVAPSLSNGCAMACAYCYVPRRKGYANPITVFANIDQILKYLERHAGRQGAKSEANQIDPRWWIYEIGENSDCSVDAMVSDNVKDTIELFRRLPNAKATFATKFVNRDLLRYSPERKTRIRFSLMPQSMARIVDIRTSPVSDRIRAINDFVDAGYEVHINLSPVIYFDGWLDAYAALFDEINEVLTEQSKRQLKSELIFLTHNDRLHEVNERWHPAAEEYLWRPELQETKFSQTGGKNLRYKRGLKSALVQQFTELHKRKLPYCAIRYAF